jgi:hypothetical protein
MKRKEFFEVIFFMFLPFFNILQENIKKRNNILSKTDKLTPKSNHDYYLNL